MRLPRFIRYMRCKHRLIRYAVDCDVREKYRILCSFVTAHSKRHPSIKDLSAWGHRITFSINVDTHEKSSLLHEFDVLLESLCKRLGFKLLIGWSSMDRERGPYYSYYISPDSEISYIIEPILSHVNGTLHWKYYVKHIKGK